MSVFVFVCFFFFDTSFGLCLPVCPVPYCKQIKVKIVSTVSQRYIFGLFTGALYCLLYFLAFDWLRQPRFLAVKLTKLDVLEREWDERLIKTFYKIAANYGNS